jgi:hypothetical protein
MPKAKSLPHQIAANTRWSKEDPTRQGEIMRGALEAKFLDQVDPDRELPEPERDRRAAAARRAFYQRLTLASVRARTRRKAIAQLASAAGSGDAA